MVNPTIEELQNSEKFEKIAELKHPEIKEFVLSQVSVNNSLTRVFMIYQFVMILVGLFFLTRSIVLAFHENILPFYYSIAALIFCFSALIIIHELLHGIALKITGAKKISFGGYFRKFIFYAEANRHVLNRRQFELVALTPLLTVQVLTLLGVILLFSHPSAYFVIIVMTAHSLFCAGDVILLSIFYRDKNAEIFTYDVKEEKTSYYFRKINYPNFTEM